MKREGRWGLKWVNGAITQLAPGPMRRERQTTRPPSLIFTTGDRVVGDDYVSHDIVLGIVYFSDALREGRKFIGRLFKRRGGVGLIALTAMITFSPAGGRVALAQAIHGPPEAAAVEATIIAPLPITIATTADDESPAFGASLLAALRLGVLGQDINFIATSFEDGQAINPEIQFAAPEFLDFVLSPRPTLGGTVSTAGGTNTLYGGLNWHFRPFGQFEPFEPLFVDFFFGLSLHDGNSTDNNTVAQIHEQSGSHGCPSWVQAVL